MVRKTAGVYPCGERYSKDATEVARYTYYQAKLVKDKDGKEKIEFRPYLQVRRMSDKKFPQYHFVGTTFPADENDDRNWKYGEPVGPKVPYNYKALHEAKNDAVVHITEGEKDADTLTDLGLLAITCNSSYLGWRDEHAMLLARFANKIFVHEDNDHAGRRFVESVIRSLKRCNCPAEIYVVRYSHLERGGDATKWCELEGYDRVMSAEDRDIVADKFKAYVEETAEKQTRPILPVVHIYDGEVARAIDETEDHILAAVDKAHNLMKRGGKVVLPVYRATYNSAGVEIYVTSFQRVTAKMLSDILTKRCCTFSRDMGVGKNRGPRAIEPPEYLLEGFLQRGYWDLKEVVGIIHCPTMRPDGTIFDYDGLDRDGTHLYRGFSGYFRMEEVPKEPTKKEALLALSVLRELLFEFPFQSPVDEAVAIAAILNVIGRGAFALCPAFLFTAPGMANGKSFLVDVISTIATGRECPVINMEDANEEENKKLLTSVLLDGSQLISLDNLTNKIGGAFLCQMVERPVVKPRVLGQNSAPEIEFRGTVLGTGNNVIPYGDITRRILTARLNANIENPENRRFKSNPLQLLAQDRGRFVHAALTIMRAYQVTDEYVDCEPVASYGDWSKFVREPLIWLGLPDVWESTKEAKADDPIRIASIKLIELWREHLGERINFTVDDFIRKVEGKCPEYDSNGKQCGGFPIESLREHILENAYNRQGGIDKLRLAKWFGRLKDHVYDGYKIVVVTKSNRDGNTWAVVPAAWTPTERCKQWFPPVAPK